MRFIKTNMSGVKQTVMKASQGPLTMARAVRDQGLMTVSALPLFLIHLMSTDENRHYIKLFGYIIWKDILPTAAAIAFNSKTYDTLYDESQFSYAKLFLLMLCVVSSITLVIIPRSLRFLAHILMLNVWTPSHFSGLTKQIRVADNKICIEKKCPTTRYIVGDIIESLTYINQIIYVIKQRLQIALYSFLLSSKFTDEQYDLAFDALGGAFNVGGQLYLLALGALLIGDTTLRARYGSDGICLDHRVDILNNSMKTIACIGILQMMIVKGIQFSLKGGEYFPTFMLSSMVSVLFCALIHYIDVPRYQFNNAFNNFLIRRFSPLSQFHQQSESLVKSIFEEIENHLKSNDEKGYQGHLSYLTWTRDTVMAKLKKTHLSAALLFAEKYFTYFRKFLPEEFKSTDKFLSDPVFLKVLFPHMLLVDNLVSKLFAYKSAIERVCTCILNIKDIYNSSIDGLENRTPIGRYVDIKKVLDTVMSWTFDNFNLFRPEIIFSVLPDGFDKMLTAIGWLRCKVSLKLEWVEELKSSIHHYRKQKQFLQKILNHLPKGFMRLIVNNLRDEKLLEDLKALQTSIEQYKFLYSSRFSNYDCVQKSEVKKSLKEYQEKVKSAPSCQFDTMTRTALGQTTQRFFDGAENDSRAVYDADVEDDSWSLSSSFDGC